MRVLPDVTTTSVPLLAGYPHVAGCPTCRRLAAELTVEVDPAALVVAVLAFHDGCHRHDPRDVAPDHFGF